MCGICGVVSKESIDKGNISLIEKMKETLFHRGPDEEGRYKGSNVFLAMRRLSIIDLVGGQQPLFNEAKTIVLVANAEIYNYLELTAQLRNRGHIFKTKTDCETIVHLYEEKGLGCLQDLRGMFAFALWDVSKQRLFLARDRMGEKPLYLYEEKNILFFTSELKALLKNLPNKFSLDPQAVDLFFHYQYVPEPMTPIKNIRKLPSAHYLELDIRSWDTNPRPYWNPLAVSPIDADPIPLIRKEFDQVTSLCLHSDVAVGLSLSGGLDSGSLAALSAPKYKDTLNAFTVGYSGTPACDERREAETFARQLKLPFHSVELSPEDFVNSFPEIIFASDDPIADIAAYGYFAVMRLARKQGIKVMLSGFGGDELFWGYWWVGEAVRQSKKKFKIVSARDKKKSPNYLIKVVNHIHYLLKYGRAPTSQMIFYDLDPHFQDADLLLAALYTKEFKRDILPNNSYSLFTVEDSWQPIELKICKLLFDSWLVSNCLVLGDRLSMASSVECRLPLVDYRLVEIIFGLRKRYSDYNLNPKAWLREAMYPLLPKEVLNRPKRGFTPPEQVWFKAVLDNYGQLAYDGYLVESKILDRNFLVKYLNLTKNSAGDKHLAYKIVCFELWCRLFLGKTSLKDIRKR